MNPLPFDPRITTLSCTCVRLRTWGGASYSAPYWRFYWNGNRGAGVRSASGVVPLTPRKYVLIPPNTDFTGELVSPVTHFYVHFEAAPPYDRVEPGVYEGAVDGRVRDLIRQVRSLADSESEAARCRGAVALQALLHTALAGLPESLLRVRESDERIDNALALMTSRLDRVCPNEELAAVAGMNVNAFIRRFGEIVGDSPQRHHIRQRVERACVMLHFGKESIDQIAEKTGFCDRYHFSHVFKRLRGVGPATFRRSRRPQTGFAADSA